MLLDSVIVGDSIWKNIDLINKEDVKNLDLIVIPVFDFDNDIFEYDTNKSIIELLKIRTDVYSALITKNDSLLGYLKIAYSPIYKNCSLHPTDTTKDAILDFMTRKNDTIIGYDWICYEGTVLDKKLKSYSFWNKVYHIIQEYKTEQFFTLPGIVWDFWFVSDNKLMAYNVNLDKVLGEKELIKRIRRTEVDGMIRYTIDYKFNKYPN